MAGTLAAPSQAAVAYSEGQANRAVLGGTWLFRQDDANQGLAFHYMDQRSKAGWTPITVPHNWNATDTFLNRSSVGWYRRDIRLSKTPRHTLTIARFDGANH